jgi:hypothetical protein
MVETIYVSDQSRVLSLVMSMQSKQRIDIVNGEGEVVRGLVVRMRKLAEPLWLVEFEAEGCVDC